MKTQALQSSLLQTSGLISKSSGRKRDCWQQPSEALPSQRCPCPAAGNTQVPPRAFSGPRHSLPVSQDPPGPGQAVV